MFGRAQFKLARELAERMLEAAESSRDRASLYTAHALLGETLVMQEPNISMPTAISS